MPESNCIALVDLGSNAIRCEIVELRGKVSRSLYRHRSPIRLGSEVFAKGEISPGKIEAIAEACEQFAEQCRVHGVEVISGIATSAAREAKNHRELVTRIDERSGIKIEVISGEEECRLLALAVSRVMDLSQGMSLLVDLGGGSIEVSLVADGRMTSSQSHPLGALRFDHDKTLRGPALLTELEAQLRERGSALMQQLAETRIDRYITVGGHMDALVELLENTGLTDESAEVKTLHSADLDRLVTEMSPQDADQLARRYRLKPDRADSILAAGKAYLWIASLVDAPKLWAPGVSLRDGMIAALQGETLG